MINHLMKETKVFARTDFKVDMQGGVQGLLQTTTRPIRYRDTTLGYLEVVTQVEKSEMRREK